MKLSHSGEAFFFEEIVEEELKSHANSDSPNGEDTENGWLSDNYLSSGSDAGSDADADENSQPNGEQTKEQSEQQRKPKTRYKKKLRLSSQQIEDLHLHEDQNEVVFSCDYRLPGHHHLQVLHLHVELRRPDRHQ